MGIGEYPLGYNPRVHGAYVHWRYYGKPDTPFSEVKIADIGAWIGRRNKSPTSFIHWITRAFWRQHYKFGVSKFGGSAYYYQLFFGMSLTFYIITYRSHANERHTKYH